MFDFILRAIRHPIDYIGVLQWHKVTLLRSEQNADGSYAFIFKKPARLTWKAGQHGVWWFFHERLKGGNWRAFSIASSEKEDEIKIATIIPEQPSAFKLKLQSLQPGDSIWLQGPFGEFHAHQKRTLVGVAGGIGITPFRALAYDIANGHLPNTTLELIYANNKGYAFAEELHEWTEHSDALTVHYVTSADEVNAKLDALFTIHKNNAHYCLSGSPGMISALQKTCREKGITKIINDPFKGY